MSLPYDYTDNSIPLISVVLAIYCSPFRLHLFIKDLVIPENGSLRCWILVEFLRRPLFIHCIDSCLDCRTCRQIRGLSTILQISSILASVNSKNLLQFVRHRDFSSAVIITDIQSITNIFTCAKNHLNFTSMRSMIIHSSSDIYHIIVVQLVSRY